MTQTQTVTHCQVPLQFGSKYIPMAVADIRGHKGRMPPPRANFFHFHVVLEENWSNSMLASPWGWRTSLWEVLDLPLCV